MAALLLHSILLIPPPAADVPDAAALSLRILDGEGLYTATGGLKPVSDGFWQTRFPATEDTSAAVETVRRRLATLPLGPDLEAGVLVFAAPFDGRRAASAFVVHRPALRALIGRRADVFEPIGVTPETPPQQVMERIDRAPRAARWRAFGLAFGYPDHAVEFFVTAGEEQARTGRFVARDFVHLPTFATDRGRFVYAVPPGHAERAEDRKLRAAAMSVLDRYRGWRAVYVGDGKAGATALLRAWVAPPVVFPATRCPATARRTTQKSPLDTGLRPWHSSRFGRVNLRRNPGVGLDSE